MEVRTLSSFMDEVDNGTSHQGGSLGEQGWQQDVCLSLRPCANVSAALWTLVPESSSLSPLAQSSTGSRPVETSLQTSTLKHSAGIHQKPLATLHFGKTRTGRVSFPSKDFTSLLCCSGFWTF
jgi:hypothetical protein